MKTFVRGIRVIIKIWGIIMSKKFIILDRSRNGFPFFQCVECKKRFISNCKNKPSKQTEAYLAAERHVLHTHPELCVKCDRCNNRLISKKALLLHRQTCRKPEKQPSQYCWYEHRRGIVQNMIETDWFKSFRQNLFLDDLRLLLDSLLIIIPIEQLDYTLIDQMLLLYQFRKSKSKNIVLFECISKILQDELIQIIEGYCDVIDSTFEIRWKELCILSEITNMLYK